MVAPNLNTLRRRSKRRTLAWRDGARCFYCRLPFPDPELAGSTLDHYVPHSLLATNANWNMVLACRPCNLAKADVLPWPVVWLLLGLVDTTPAGVDTANVHGRPGGVHGDGSVFTTAPSVFTPPHHTPDTTGTGITPPTEVDTHGPGGVDTPPSVVDTALTCVTTPVTPVTPPQADTPTRANWTTVNTPTPGVNSRLDTVNSPGAQVDTPTANTVPVGVLTPTGELADTALGPAVNTPVNTAEHREAA
ncbi:HNH endonuclease [Streptomyces sp. NBRC 109706]|uniref:HNH endonuclease n=1 Tax=Streptomyces sp. NBRC 109706 TaxID=1550035 RepID=UPI00082FC051|nr:HNH endonuclease signature motif containing protein [Streptomyces sp. NBRC 109706]